MIAALYVQTDGIYYGLNDVDPWDEERDARLYNGPWPVVAHPPCERWCALAGLVASLNAHRADSARYQIGADGGTFKAALAAVRTYGGVLEHPAYSLAWPQFQLPRPVVRNGWTASLIDPGWSTEVSQSAYGHPCRKRTWLYYVGQGEPPALDWTEPPVTAQVSAFGIDRARKLGLTTYANNKSDPTPTRFRDTLIEMAEAAHWAVQLPQLST